MNSQYSRHMAVICDLSHFNCYSFLVCFFPRPALLVPEKLNFSPNLEAQQLAISWLKGTVTTFDILILRAELNETVFYVRAFLLLLICPFHASLEEMLLQLILITKNKTPSLHVQVDEPEVQMNDSYHGFVFCRKRSLCHLIR